jgi:dTDP-4-amino-4,6-dideoxygalactose transaminase
MRIPFNQPYMTGRELDYIRQAHDAKHLSGGGQFTGRCQSWLERNLACHKALLTHSCTGALEIAALLANLEPGDEIIMPSFTFVSTANAFTLRGAVPVFVDIREDTLNIDERLIERALTKKTRAIVVVHYAGVGCEMDAIGAIAAANRLLFVEDAAHGVLAYWRGRALGSIAPLATLSFHETKNVMAGEGGALLVNDPSLFRRAEVIREKGTDRNRFLRGEVDKYTWVDVGSSYAPAEILAAFLYAQMEHAEEMTTRRLAIWNAYHSAFEDLERREIVRRPIVPEHCRHNAHLYYLLVRDADERSRVLARLKERGIGALFHYVPLHSSAAGRKFGRCPGPLPMTDALSGRLFRLPLWLGVEQFQSEVIEQVRACLMAT